MSSLHISAIPTHLPHLISPHHNTTDSDGETAVDSPPGSQVGEMGYISDLEIEDEGGEEGREGDGGEREGQLVSAWSDDSSDEAGDEQDEDEEVGEENENGNTEGVVIEEEEEEETRQAVDGGDDDETASVEDMAETAEVEDDEEAAGTAVEGDVSPGTDDPAGTDIDAEEGDDREGQNIPA